MRFTMFFAENCCHLRFHNQLNVKSNHCPAYDRVDKLRNMFSAPQNVHFRCIYWSIVGNRLATMTHSANGENTRERNENRVININVHHITIIGYTAIVLAILSCECWIARWHDECTHVQHKWIKIPKSFPFFIFFLLLSAVLSVLSVCSTKKGEKNWFNLSDA